MSFDFLVTTVVSLFKWCRVSCWIDRCRERRKSSRKNRTWSINEIWWFCVERFYSFKYLCAGCCMQLITSLTEVLARQKWNTLQKKTCSRPMFLCQNCVYFQTKTALLSERKVCCCCVRWTIWGYNRPTVHLYSCRVAWFRPFCASCL